MSYVSTSLGHFADSLDAYSADGAVLKPDAMQSIVAFLREMAADASKLERMLERRMTDADLPKHRASRLPEIAPAGNILIFPDRPRPRAATSGSDVA